MRKGIEISDNYKKISLEIALVYDLADLFLSSSGVLSYQAN